MHLVGYRIGSALYENATYTLHRALREQDGQPVLIKTVREGSSNAQAFLDREYHIVAELSREGVVPAVDLLAFESGNALVIEDPGGSLLRHRLLEEKPGIDATLRIAIVTASILDALHQHQVVHKALCPDVMLVDPEMRHVWLIGFDQAQRLSGLDSEAQHLPWQETRLAYTSPEQTGRMHLKVDHRTDFYALGVTLYEMLTGRLPFEDTDPLRLVHAHIARAPVSPCDIQPDVPRVVSDIVQKLLAKAPEERYQSARGLKADLETCLHQWQTHQTITPFVLGRHDVPDRFEIPEKLYGREKEIARLLATFERIRAGQTGMALVAGYAGVGKTSLVRAIYQPVVQQGGYLVGGKFDQFERSIPYSAVIQAFRDLVKQILAEEEGTIQQWRELLLHALGPNGQVIIDVIPELAWVIGPQPPLPDVGLAEAENRFNFYFRQFIGVFARPEHPLVLFLDDMQWADSASLKLIITLAAGQLTRGFLLLGAYRDNEVTSHHPLLKVLGELRQHGVEMDEITLPPLGLEHVRTLIADTLHASETDVDTLARLVYEKTDGNPFFARAFLKSLYEESLLGFDVDRGWHWDVAQIAGLRATENVVSLMSRKISRLEDAAQDVLKMAACIGNRFDLETLATVYEQEAETTTAHLNAALREDLIVRHDEGYAFYHDRIQEAAYALIPDDKRPRVHYRIGTLLLQHTAADDLPDRLFEITNHLNAARDLLQGTKERYDLARLNLEAGRKAKASAAYRLALEYCIAGLAVLDPQAWDEQYEYTFALSRERAECEFLCGHFDEAEQHFDQLLAQARSDLEKAEIYSLKIMQYEIQARFDDAVQAGREGLALFGIHVPGTRAEKQDVFQEAMAAIQAHLTDRSIADLIALPVMTDEAMKMAMKLLMTVWAPAYIAGDTALYTFVSALMVRLSLDHGNTEESAFAYVIHGVTVGAGLGDYASGFAFGSLALRVNDQFQDRKLRAKIHHMFGCFLNIWCRPLQESFVYLKEAYRSGLETGDFAYATYAVFSETWNAFQCSTNLNEVFEVSLPNLGFLQQIKNDSFADAQQVLLHWIMNLQGRTASPLSFDSDVFEEHVYRTHYQGLPFFETFYFTTKLTSLYHFGAYHEALAMAQQAEVVEPSLSGTLWDAILVFHYALALTACFADADETTQANYRRKLDALQGRMQHWTHYCPENFRHQHLLITAERNVLEGSPDEAMTQYEQAIQEAHTHGFLQHEALANERFALFFLARGHERIAALYMAEAHRLYTQWGASAKSTDLEKRYAGLLTGASHDHRNLETVLEVEALDLATVMKAAQVISGEMQRDRLIEMLMRIVIESAGAQKGLLILEQAGQLVIEATSLVTDEDVTILAALPVESSPHLSASIVHYVHRTGENLVVTDAARDARFMSDGYIRDNATRSVLCVPIRHQGKLIGMLYLENNLMAGAFTPDRMEVVRILASQAAISLENARLYEEMKQEMAERKHAEEALRRAHDELELRVTERTIALSDINARLTQEIAERNEAEAALRASEERLVLSLEATKDGLYDYDIPSSMVFVSDNYYRQRGYAPQAFEMTFEKWTTLVHPDDLDPTLDALHQHFSGTNPDFSVEYRMRCADGSYGWVHDRGKIVAYTEDGKPKRMIGINIDISERKQVELQLQEAKEAAEAANRAKSEFLANMSHELRTPLNAILGYAQILKRDNRLTGTQRTGIDVIERSGEHLLTLINDILDLSKIEAGKLEVQPTEFHLPEFVRHIADMARIRAEQKGLAFLYESLAPLPTLVEGDERRLRQILLNLLGNAVKFTETGGVSFKVDYHEATAGRVRVRFQVEDTGIGIAPEDLDLIFQPFQQAENAQQNVEGTGLGLTISQRLAQLMGGELHVESTPGAGSTFWVDLELPVTGDAPALAVSAEATPPITGFHGTKNRILVVDDKWENRSVLTNLLAPLGFVLLEAENGQDALDKVAAFRPDLVLMDLVMPVMDGFEATRRLRQMPGGEEMTIIALSASVFEHSRLQSREAGCADFLQKPVRAALLLDSLRTYLDLEWVYAEMPDIPVHLNETNAVLTAETSIGVVPPVEVLQKLHELALMGHLQGLLEHLDRIDTQDAACIPFTASLRRMARDYDMKRIRTFLKPYLETET